MQAKFHGLEKNELTFVFLWNTDSYYEKSNTNCKGVKDQQGRIVQYCPGQETPFMENCKEVGKGNRINP